MNTTLLFRLVSLIALLVLGTATLNAQDLQAVRTRMDQRQGAVDDLRNRGVAGENAQGYLEARGAAAAAEQKVISEENADRRAVYAALAAQNKTTPEQIGRQRAHQIAQRARSGVWIQDPSGAWRKK